MTSSTARIILFLACPPSTMFRREEVVASFAFDVRHDTLEVVVAKEAMQDCWFVEAGDHESADVRYRRYEVRCTIDIPPTLGIVVVASLPWIGIEVEG